MENNSNWSHRQEEDGPQEYTQHPTGARFTPTGKSKDHPHQFTTYPHITPEESKDSENEYQNTNSVTHSFSDDNPVMGSENTFDTFSDTDPNRYNNNAGLGMPEERTENSALSDDAESNEFDGNSDSDTSNYPQHPEF